MNAVDFASLTRALADAGQGLRFPARGRSMRPFLRENDILIVMPVDQVQLGDVVLVCTAGDHCLAHRVVRRLRDGHRIVALQTQGDAHAHPDPVVPWSAVVGQVTAFERAGRRTSLTGGATRWLGLLWAWLVPLRHAAARVLARMRRLGRPVSHQGPRTGKRSCRSEVLEEQGESAR